MTESQPRKCYCRCGQTVKNNYAPGHDARHVAEMVRLIRNLAEDVKAGRRPSHDLTLPVERVIDSMPTDALKRKLAMRLFRMGWDVFGREARGMAAYHREGVIRYGRGGLETAWRRSFPRYRVSDLAATDDVYFGLLAIAGWDRDSAGLAAS